MPLDVHGQPSVGVVPQPVIVVQVPAEQVFPAAHGVESALLPVAPHTEVPVEQLVVPVLHGIDGTSQVVPCVQEQAPAEQARFVPHDVPFAALVPVSTHIIEPVAQDCFPVWQGALAGVQAVFSVHWVQAPPLHTMLAPQVDPSLTFAVFMHTDVPVEQSVAPVWHRLPFGVQTSPILHALQLPPLQTRFVPQLAPFARFVP
jgi:hypothetical protein